jgi:acetylornithine deacetylase/succinyl-diaminopimelate desuccinylase-like protein
VNYLRWDRVRHAVEAEVERGLDDLLAALRISSVVAWGDEHLSESAMFLSRLLEQDGWTADRFVVGGNHAVFAEIGPGRPDDTAAMLLYAHHDVQPPEPLEAWTTPPFEPAIRDGRIYARGSADDKGQFFCHIFAVRALQRLGGLPVRVKFFLDGEEEAGNPDLAATLEVLRPRMKAGFVYTADGPAHPTGRPRVTFGFRGMLHMRLTVRTASSNLHSGHWGNLAPDAAVLLAQVVAGMKGADGRVTVPGFYDGVRPPTATEREALASIPFDPGEVAAQIGARALWGPFDVSPMERMMFLPTLTVTGLASGYVGVGFQNAIPAEASAHIDIRYVPDQDPDHIFSVLSEYLGVRAPEAQLTRLGSMPPSHTPMDTPAVRLVSDAIRRGFGVDPVLLPRSGGSAPDSLFTVGLGLPSLWAHVANADCHNHAPNENMSVSNLRAGALASAALILNLSAG